MKFQRIPLSIAAASLFTLAQLASAQADEVPGKVIVPESSIEHPWDIGQRAHTNISIVIPDKVVLGANRVPVAENPASLACIYGLVKKTTGCPKTATILPTGGAKAIALVDAYDNPDAVTDLSTFAAAYGYRTPNFTVVKMGSPAANAGWALEESLDIEYAFGMAPDAKIYLVEANSDSLTDLFAAEDKATALVKAAGGGEISNSRCGGDFHGEDSYRHALPGAKGVVYFASAGDSGGAVCYPSASPYVVSVGGTTIFCATPRGYSQAKPPGGDAGGGPSQFESRPTYQNVIQSIVGTTAGDAGHFGGCFQRVSRGDLFALRLRRLVRRIRHQHFFSDFGRHHQCRRQLPHLDRC
jgi:kumamolisin